MRVEKALPVVFKALTVAFVLGAPIVLIVAISTIPGCPRMRTQPKLDPYEESDFFADQSSARHPPRGTIARSQRVTDAAFYYGRKKLPPVSQASAPIGTSANERPRSVEAKAPPQKMAEKKKTFVSHFPIPITRKTLLDGRTNFNVYCSPCHGKSGYGDGVVVHRGFPSPPSFHKKELREAPVGYLFDVISNGYGVMYSHGARLSPEQRWEVVAYVRALQLSQHAPRRLLSPRDRARLNKESP